MLQGQLILPEYIIPIKLKLQQQLDNLIIVIPIIPDNLLAVTLDFQRNLLEDVDASADLHLEDADYAVDDVEEEVEVALLGP